ncbi:acetylserotonin O-methyltransferase [Solirubrobacter taibaiensis]|nr:acetylserotonin O-methyltransferase [Solirubrobacter taibaiensis]
MPSARAYDGVTVPPAELKVLEIARGYQLSQALYAVAKLGVADALDAGPLTAEAIAETVDARAPELRRVLRALVAAGVFCELEDGRFESNDAAAALRARAPGGMRDVVVNFGEEMYQSFGELLHTVRTGETAFDHVYGAPLFEYYATHPETEASAAARMRARTLPVARELAASDLLRGANTLVDVGGGTGTLVAEVLRHRPDLAGVLLERPGMLALAQPYLAEQGVADRCALVEGDFFASIPAGGEVYVLKSVLHDWDDERCVAILRTCRAAMDDAARLIVVELILPERMTAAAPMLSAALLDLIMLAYAGGRERTRAEFTELFDQAGLRLASTTAPTAGPAFIAAVAA